MKTITRTVLAMSATAAALLFSQQALANCYEIYGADQQMLYRSMRSPVDLSVQLHQTVPAMVKGGTLVFRPSEQGCEIEINRLKEPMVVEIDGAGVRSITPRPTGGRAPRS